MANSSRIPNRKHATARLPRDWRPWVGSLLSWGTLGAAACLAALIVLSPRILENRHLERRLLENAAELRHLESQTRQLKVVSQALRTDPDFIARVAAAERLQKRSEETQIPVSKELGFDVSQPRESPVVLPRHHDSPFLGVLKFFAMSGWFRMTCLLSTGVLFLLSFGSYPNGFLTGSPERVVEVLHERYSNS